MGSTICWMEWRSAIDRHRCCYAAAASGCPGVRFFRPSCPNRSCRLGGGSHCQNSGGSTASWWKNHHECNCRRYRGGTSAIIQESEHEFVPDTGTLWPDALGRSRAAHVHPEVGAERVDVLVLGCNIQRIPHGSVEHALHCWGACARRLEQAHQDRQIDDKLQPLACNLPCVQCSLDTLALLFIGTFAERFRYADIRFGDGPWCRIFSSARF
mmetsp:Transcript_2021/g.3571  ORF Transcript_2021/g.3571 Transcript_2021/m.3571 type:complete len:212 (+) Transcript_2021:81-716(+)